MTTSSSVGYLLDTHAFLWLGEGDSRCSDSLRRTLAEPQSVLYLSLASIWEMAIKSSLGKLSLQIPLGALIEKLCADLQIQKLLVTTEHCLGVERLPLHHRDPFDRLLISQAIHEGFILISKDRAFDAYPIHKLW